MRVLPAKEKQCPVVEVTGREFDIEPTNTCANSGIRTLSTVVISHQNGAEIVASESLQMGYACRYFGALDDLGLLYVLYIQGMKSQKLLVATASKQISSILNAKTENRRVFTYYSPIGSSCTLLRMQHLDSVNRK